MISCNLFVMIGLIILEILTRIPTISANDDDSDDNNSKEESVVIIFMFFGLGLGVIFSQLLSRYGEAIPYTVVVFIAGLLLSAAANSKGK